MSNQDHKIPSVDELLTQLLHSVQIPELHAEHTALVSQGLVPVANEQAVSLEDRYLSSLAALLLNVAPQEGHFEKAKALEVIAQIDELVSGQLDEILHNASFQKLESAWRGVQDVADHIPKSANITLDLLDVSKDELQQDFENHASDIFASSLFQKVYVAEYDQYGGRPYGVLLGDYQFAHVPSDLFWLRSMSKVAAASHAPFLAAVSAEFFGCQNVHEVEAIQNLEGVVNHPRYGDWNIFRDSDEACYIGLTFPRYVQRLPWNPETNPVPHLNYREEARGDSSKYLWGNAAWLMARNLIRSFHQAGWCQHIRGPKGGGLIQGLPIDTFDLHGQEETKMPVEVLVPDYRELEFAKSGFIPLVWRKASADAAFFSVQSVKRPAPLADPKDAENSQLVCNLAYTFSVCRIGHHVKGMMRDNIGSSADATYIKSTLNNWIQGFVTTAVNPDEPTLQAFPFKAADIQVEATPGQIGFYKCTISVLPHAQFEGMDVELRLESRLG